jgi:signal transduction histidine kinase
MRVPLLVLSALLVAAMIVGIGGVQLSRRIRQERISANRAALRNFAEKWQEEFSRLQALYEDDLIEIAVGVRGDRPWSLAEGCRNLQGVCAAANIKAASLGEADQKERLIMEPFDSGTTERLPEVWILGTRVSLPADAKRNASFLVHADDLLSATGRNGNTHGWIASQNPNFTLFWCWAGKNAPVVMMVDWREVNRRTEEYLQRWARAGFADLRAADPVAAVWRGDDTQFLGEAAASPQAPDVIVPIQNRMGSWQIVSHDRVITRIGYSTAGLTATLLLSAGMVLLGIVVFRHQVRAQRLAERRVSFVNRVSHELGTPLTNMLLNLDLASDAIASKPEAARQRLGLVTEEAQRLVRLVSNVLTFSRVERGALEINRVCCIPDEILRKTICQFEPALRRREIAVASSYAAGDGVLLDPDALAQIAGNLLSNVEKYAADGKRVEIASRHENDFLTVRICDYGPGITAAEQERVFRPFERLSNSVNEGASGTGLGLAIARDLAERMGGRISLISGDGGGCVFQVVLPAPRVLVSVSGAKESAA